MKKCIQDTQVTTVSAQRLPTDLLGEESGARVCALVERFGEDGERAVLPLTEEIVKGRREIQQCAEKIQTCKEVIEHLRRQLFGPKRERYVDPNQGE